MSLKCVAASNQKLEIPGPVTATSNKRFLLGMCWVKFNTTGGIVDHDVDLLQYSTGTSLTQSRFGLNTLANTSGRIQVKGRATDAEPLKTFSDLVFINFDVWHHVAGLIDYETSHAWIWVDGEHSSSGPMNGTFAATRTASTPSLHGRIGGGLTDPTQGLDGVEEDARLYDTPGIDPSDVIAPVNQMVRTIYTLRGKDSIIKGLLHRWPLKDRSSGTIVSAANLVSGERIVATPVNSPTWSGESVVSFEKKALRRSV